MYAFCEYFSDIESEKVARCSMHLCITEIEIIYDRRYSLERAWNIFNTVGKLGSFVAPVKAKWCYP